MPSSVWTLSRAQGIVRLPIPLYIYYLHEMVFLLSIREKWRFFECDKVRRASAKKVPIHSLDLFWSKCASIVEHTCAQCESDRKPCPRRRKNLAYYDNNMNMNSSHIERTKQTTTTRIFLSTRSEVSVSVSAIIPFFIHSSRTSRPGMCCAAVPFPSVPWSRNFPASVPCSV